MKTYTIYFEIYGKKLKTSVKANSAKEAKQIIIDKIIFHKIDVHNLESDIPNNIKDLFGDIFKF